MSSELDIDDVAATSSLAMRNLTELRAAMTWRPIKTYPLPAFVVESWYMPGRSVLLWEGFPFIGNYSYTKLGKGRWKTHYQRSVNPTHWMPLPPPHEGAA